MTGVWLGVALLLPPAMAVALRLPRLRASVLLLSPWSALPSLGAAWWAAEERVEVPWLLIGSRLGLDGTGRVFLFFTALLWLAAGLFALRYLRADARRRSFMIYFLLAMTGNLGVTVAQDMLSFYLFFALMSFASYGLIVHHRDASAREAGRIYIVLVVLGEALFFAGVALVAGATGETGFRETQALAGLWAESPLVVGLLAVGLSVKVGAIPLHVWLPLAHPAAPAPASAVLSGAMIKAGLLGWIRFLPVGQTIGAEDWGILGVLVGFTAAYFGVIAGVVQRDAKTVLAYSSISQMGLITVAVGLGLAVPDAWDAARAAVLVYALHHALAKASLFLGVGVAHAGSSARWQRWGVIGGMAIPALALAGAPLTSGAIAKTVLKHATAAVPAWADLLEGLLTLAAVGTTLLMGRVFYLVRPRCAEPGVRLPAGMWLPWMLLLGPSILFGRLLPGLGLPMPSGEKLVSPTVLAGFLWPLALGLVLSAAAWKWGGKWHLAGRFAIPAGDLWPVVLWMLRRIAGSLGALAWAPRAATSIGRSVQWAMAPRMRRGARPAGERLPAWETFSLSYLLIAVVLVVLLAATRI